MGSVEPPFLPQIQPESPEKSVSDIPDFKIFLKAPMVEQKTFMA